MGEQQVPVVLFGLNLQCLAPFIKTVLRIIVSRFFFNLCIGHFRVVHICPRKPVNAIVGFMENDLFQTEDKPVFVYSPVNNIHAVQVCGIGSVHLYPAGKGRGVGITVRFVEFPV